MKESDEEEEEEEARELTHVGMMRLTAQGLEELRVLLETEEVDVDLEDD